MRNIIVTALFNRLCPSSLHVTRRGRWRPDRAELKLRTALRASDERLVTRSEIEKLAIAHLTRVTTVGGR